MSDLDHHLFRHSDEIWKAVLDRLGVLVLRMFRESVIVSSALSMFFSRTALTLERGLSSGKSICKFGTGYLLQTRSAIQVSSGLER